MTRALAGAGQRSVGPGPDGGSAKCPAGGASRNLELLLADQLELRGHAHVLVGNEQLALPLTAVAALGRPGGGRKVLGASPGASGGVTMSSLKCRSMWLWSSSRRATTWMTSLSSSRWTMPCTATSRAAMTILRCLSNTSGQTTRLATPV